MKYDIFISYRRKDTGDKAEHLKDLLERAGYEDCVSFDRENLTGIFDVELARRIDRCRDFLLVVGKNSFNYSAADHAPEQVDLYNYLGTCSIDDFEKKIMEMGPTAPIDFVRIEIARALNRKDLNIIPIALESSDNFDFSKIDFPTDIAGIKRHGAIFFSDNPDALFKDVMHNLRPRLQSRPRIPIGKIVIPCVVVALLGMGAWIWHQHIKKEDLRLELEKKYECFEPFLSKNLSITQLKTIDEILSSMVPVRPDTLWVSKYEFTIGWWYGALGQDYDVAMKDYPVVSKTYGEVLFFIDSLNRMTGLNIAAGAPGFGLPSVEDWEYAARGGRHGEKTVYAGSDNPDSVAWYSDNSDGRLHPSDGRQGKTCNALDLFDMSGNVGEMCMTPYDIGEDGARWTVCGGDYNSSADAVTISSRRGIDANAKSPLVGFRLTIRKEINF